MILPDPFLKNKIKSSKEVEQILSKKIQSSNPLFENKKVQASGVLWTEESFRLEKFTPFTAANKEIKEKILFDLSMMRFKEAYSIEKAGMSFTAKMSLLAESQNEQKLYSIFSKEEATHFHYIQAVLSEYNKEAEVESSKDPFIKLLNEIIISGQRRPLLFIIQVILEGWGIDHYSFMERTCLDQGIKKQLRSIIQDEAAHHACGVSLFDENDLSEAERSYIIEMMSEFLKMLSSGPLGMLNILEENLGEFERSAFFHACDAEEESRRKSDFIKSLMLKSKAVSIFRELESYKLFSLSVAT